MQGIDFCEFIDHIVRNNKVSHAYLFELNNYDDEYDEVLKFVKTLICNKKTSFASIDGCNLCNICNLIDNNNCPDFFVIEPDGKEIKKNQLIWLREEYQNKSILGLKRVYLIKQAETMNSFAANSILKFLEEPNEDVVAILLTTNKYKMLDTIVSRCQYYKFEFDYSNRNYNVNNELLVFLDFLSKKDLFKNYNYIIEKIFVDKLNLAIVLKNVQQNILLFIENSDLLPKEYYNIFKMFTIDELSNYIYIFEDVLDRLNYNVNFKLIVDYLFSKLIGGEIDD